MELSEAIKKLRETQDSYLKDELDIAIEVVLKALDNSISKDEVQNKINTIANQTWYVADGEEAKRSCMDELEDLIN